MRMFDSNGELKPATLVALGALFLGLAMTSAAADIEGPRTRRIQRHQGREAREGEFGDRVAANHQSAVALPAADCRGRQRQGRQR